MLDSLRLSLSQPSVWLVLVLDLLLFAGVWRFGSWLLGLLHRQLRPGLLRSLQWLWVGLITYGLIAVLVRLLRLDIEPLYTQGEALGDWFRASAGRTFAVIVLAVLAWQLVGVVTGRIVPADEFNRRTVRVRTLTGVVESTLRVVILTIAAVSVLQNLGIEATTLLAGVSVLGLAVSFGAQSLFKDVITGFFILLEDQYGVGDVITINNGGLSGGVERLNLRVTMLRALDGTVHIIPNGQIQTVSVSSKDWSRVVARLTVPPETDVDAAIGLLTRVSHELYSDEVFGKVFLEAPEINGVTGVSKDGVVLQALYKVLPKQQWGLEREFNRRVLLALEQSGLSLLQPQLIHMSRGEAAPAAAPAPDLAKQSD